MQVAAQGQASNVYHVDITGYAATQPPPTSDASRLYKTATFLLLSIFIFAL
jgi:hypothetical protein